MLRRTFGSLLILTFLGLTMLGGCSTAPRSQNQADVLVRADSSRHWFENNVNGLDEQIADSAGYVVFPDVTQFGIIFGGGTFGRGAVCRPDGTLIGWGAINTGSIGLQVGVQGFRMLMVLQNEAVLNQFMENQLAGSVAGVAVALESGTSGKAPFRNGVAIYQGANTGLMAGVNIGLDYIRYKPLDEE